MTKEEVFKLIEDHYRANQSSLVKRLSGTMGSRHNAEDTVQDSYVRACQYWDTYDPSLNIDAWLSGIRTNCIRDTKKNILLNGLVKDDLAAIPDPPRPDITDSVLIREVKEKIDALDFPENYILDLYWFKGYSSDEIAEVVPGHTANSIRQIASRYRKELLSA